MSQLFLGVNPGTTIADESAPSLMAAETVNNETTTGTAVEVSYPGDVVAKLVLGALAATTALTVELQGADNSDFDENVVSYGAFDSIGGDDDSETRYLDAQMYKKYARAVATNSVAVDAVITSLTLVPKATGLSNTRSA